MINPKNATLRILLLLSLFVLSCNSSKLTEDRAKKAVDALLARGTELPDNGPPPATLLEWQGLVQISETEMQGKARIRHMNGRMREMTGKFIFHKTSEGNWVIDKVEFRSVSGSAWWNVEVFQKAQ